MPVAQDLTDFFQKTVSDRESVTAQRMTGEFKALTAPLESSSEYEKTRAG